jgi:hypothetical protein
MNGAKALRFVASPQQVLPERDKVPAQPALLDADPVGSWNRKLATGVHARGEIWEVDSRVETQRDGRLESAVDLHKRVAVVTLVVLETGPRQYPDSVAVSKECWCLFTPIRLIRAIRSIRVDLLQLQLQPRA